MTPWRPIVAATDDINVGLLMYCAGADPNYRHFLDEPIGSALSMVQTELRRPDAVVSSLRRADGGPRVRVDRARLLGRWIGRGAEHGRLRGDEGIRHGDGRGAVGGVARAGRRRPRDGARSDRHAGAAEVDGRARSIGERGRSRGGRGVGSDVAAGASPTSATGRHGSPATMCVRASNTSGRCRERCRPTDGPGRRRHDGRRPKVPTRDAVRRTRHSVSVWTSPMCSCGTPAGSTGASGRCSVRASPRTASPTTGTSACGTAPTRSPSGWIERTKVPATPCTGSPTTTSGPTTTAPAPAAMSTRSSSAPTTHRYPRGRLLRR